MGRDEALRVLAEHRREIEGLGVRSIAVFGSVARNQAGPDSDVDILIEVRRPFGYFQFFDVQEYLEGILGRHVDLFTPKSLREDIRADVLRDAVRAA